MLQQEEDMGYLIILSENGLRCMKNTAKIIKNYYYICKYETIKK